jgi:hypothetical protein
LISCAAPASAIADTLGGVARDFPQHAGWTKILTGPADHCRNKNTASAINPDGRHDESLALHA